MTYLKMMRLLRRGKSVRHDNWLPGYYMRMAELTPSRYCVYIFDRCGMLMVWIPTEDDLISVCWRKH